MTPAYRGPSPVLGLGGWEQPATPSAAAFFRSPLWLMGYAGRVAPPVTPTMCFRSPLWLMGYAGYAAAVIQTNPGMRSLAGFWAGGMGARGSFVAPTGGPGTIWRPIWQSGTRRR